MKTQKIEFHPIADIFPLLEGEEFKDFSEDIRKNGLLNPIWTYQGQIIDGRNRYRACLKVGVKPQFREWTGTYDSIVDYVVKDNLKRRHLSKSQRSIVASKLWHITNVLHALSALDDQEKTSIITWLSARRLEK